MGRERKFDAEAERAIAEAYAAGETPASLAERFGCCEGTVLWCVRDMGGTVRGRGRPRKIIENPFDELRAGSNDGPGKAA